MSMDAGTWITAVAQRLQARWKTVDAGRLEDLAADLWLDERLRAMEPVEAADAWLAPVLVE